MLSTILQRCRLYITSEQDAQISETIVDNTTWLTARQATKFAVEGKQYRMDRPVLDSIYQRNRKLRNV